MKILLINKFLYPKGGDAICTIATSDLFRAKGHEVVLWGMAHPLNPEYQYKDLFVSNVDYNNPTGAWKQTKAALNMLYSFEAKAKVEKLLKQFKPDIVHLNNFAHQISPSILHVFKKNKVPVVMTMHDYKMVCASYTLLSNNKVCELCQNGKYYNCFLQGCVKGSKAKSLLNMIEMYLHHKILRIYDLVDVFISPSMFLENKLDEMGFKRKIVNLPNFVDTTEYKCEYSWEAKAIIYFGRLSDEKGIGTLIDAINGLDIKLKIIGDGPMREGLEKMVKDGNINNVEFLGYKTSSALKNEARKAMFVVIPSEWYENNPRSILEAFALGKPVIGANIGGIPELVQDNITGYTFKSGNVGDLKEKIEYLLKNPKKVEIMGRNARSLVQIKCNQNKYYNELLQIYGSAIENNRNRNA